jgi:hypothetical protein
MVLFGGVVYEAGVYSRGAVYDLGCWWMWRPCGCGLWCWRKSNVVRYEVAVKLCVMNELSVPPGRSLENHCCPVPELTLLQSRVWVVV